MSYETLQGKTPNPPEVVIGSKTYAVTPDTVFSVEVGKGRKYQTRYSGPNFPQMAMYFRGINIGNGYKKRFVVTQGGKRTVALKQFS